MWASKFYIWSALISTFLSFYYHPVQVYIVIQPLSFFGFAITCLNLHRQCCTTILMLLSTPSRYIHLGSHRNVHHDTSKAIKSYWSTSRCPPRYTARTVDHCALASLPNTTALLSTSVYLTSTHSWARDISSRISLTVSLIFSVWLNFGTAQRLFSTKWIHSSGLCLHLPSLWQQSPRETERPASICACFQFNWMYCL